MTYDTARKRVLLFGGTGPNDGNNNLWGWNGTAWSLDRVGDVPRAQGPSSAYEDPIGKQITHFAPTGDGQPDRREESGWSYSQGAWRHRSYWMAPGKSRAQSEMIGDPARGRTDAEASVTLTKHGPD